MVNKLIFMYVAGCLLLPGIASAQITTDGSIGAAQTLAGPAFTIPETLGTVSGGNLFHSFSTFNIQAGESVNFTTTSALNNVIARVTGGSPSFINGQLSLSPAIGVPNFYFINPAGVMFGAGASLNVPGAFHVATADYVAFTDGNFNADLGQGSTLSAAPPEAFGFLGGIPAVLSVSGATLSTTSPTGTLDLQGGEVSIGASLLNSREGDIRVTATGGDRIEVPVNTGIRANGLLTITDSTLTTASSGATDAGDLFIAGGSAALSGSTLQSFAGGAGASGDITIFSNLLNMQQVSLNTQAFGSGAPGYINVVGDERITAQFSGFETSSATALPGGISFSGGDITLADQTLVRSLEGDIDINATSLSLTGYSALDAVALRSGKAGDIHVNADTIYLNSSFMNSSTLIGTGDAGNIVVNTGALTLENVARILTNSYGVGDAGSITVNGGNIVIDSGEIIAEASITLDGVWRSISGQTGNVAVNADNLSISNNGLIGIRSRVAVADPTTVTPTLLSVNANNIDLASGGSITSQALGNIDASNIDIAFTDSLTLDNSSIASSSFEGDAGKISIRGGNVISIDNSIISTSVTGLISGTAAGNIDVTADTLVLNTGFIQANAAGLNATGGDVAVNVNNVIPSMQMLWVGGALPFVFQPGVPGFNVIQAVSPSGVSGDVSVSAPVVDLSAGLTGLADRSVKADALGRSPCQVGSGSSLAPVGRGGLPPSATELTSARSNNNRSQAPEYAALLDGATTAPECARL